MAIAKTTISLEGALALRDANDVRQRFAEAFAEFEEIEIDASGLTGIDIGIIQLLISARRSAASEGKSLTIAAGDSSVLQTALTQAGLLGPGGVSRSTNENFWLGGQHAERRVA